VLNTAYGYDETSARSGPTERGEQVEAPRRGLRAAISEPPRDDRGAPSALSDAEMRPSAQIRVVPRTMLSPLTAGGEHFLIILIFRRKQ